MQTAAKWALGIVPAGIALGALLGAAVDPDMKDAPAPWWRLTGAELFTASDEPAPEERPQDLAAARSYRPDLDYGIEVWTLPIPADDVRVLADEPLALPSAAIDEEVALEPEPGGDDESAAEADQPEAVPEAAEVHQPELAGLY